jgi:FKBP-type peptidyl-prolyl cis-trans isomerase
MNEIRINLAEINKKEGQEFLAANKQKEGVVTLESGLQYKILKAGKCPIPTKDDTVAVKYKGTLIDGTVFDSSDMAGQAAVLQVSDGHIIAGFREAMRLMPVGSKWQLFVPARLGYLDRGRGNLIGPNATLIYEVEMLGILNPENPAVEESPKNPSTQASPKSN